MVRGLNIGLDFDNVIRFSQLLKPLAILELFGVEIPWYECTREILVRQEKRFTDAQYWAIIQLAYGSTYARYMQFVRDAPEFLHRLRGDGHNLSVVTSLEGEIFDVAKEWFQGEQGFDFIEMRGVSREDGKLPVAIELKLDVFFDDNLEKLRQLIGAVPYLFLMSWHFNLCEDLPPGIQSIPNDLMHSPWVCFYEEICKLCVG